MANGRCDIRLACGWLNHHKTRILRKKLGADGPLSLLALWCYAAENRKDGNLADLPDGVIEDVSGWDGERGVFVQALREIGWLDGNQIHDWLEEQPWVTGTSARVVAARANGRKSAEARKAKFGSAQPNGRSANPERAPNVGSGNPELLSVSVSDSNEHHRAEVVFNSGVDTGALRRIQAQKAIEAKAKSESRQDRHAMIESFLTTRPLPAPEAERNHHPAADPYRAIQDPVAAVKKHTDHAKSCKDPFCCEAGAENARR